MGLCIVALLLTALALHWLPGLVGIVVVALGAFVALAGAVLACASFVVLIRYQRSASGAPDLFLELNRNRGPAAIGAATPGRVSAARRWLSGLLLGHDFVVGDVVEVRSWAEIRETLDDRGCLEELPFMPEMVGMCGQRARVFRCMHRLFDYRKTRRMRHMEGAVLLIGAVCDGSAHGGCQAACHTIWKTAWLRRVERNAGARATPVSGDSLGAVQGFAPVSSDTEVPRYVCQLTQLHAASRAISKWGVARILMPLVSGNVAPAAFVVGWLTYLFNEAQYKRRGVSFPEFPAPLRDDESREEHALTAGDYVVVRSAAEIRATLNDRLMHKGLWFEPDMSKHCGRRCTVQGEVRNLIDIVTGEMLTMKTPAYILRDVHFSGERQLFNAQYEPLFWRAAWLKPAREFDSNVTPLDGSAGIEEIRVPPH